MDIDVLLNANLLLVTSFELGVVDQVQKTL
jgi:hypothetical protein